MNENDIAAEIDSIRVKMEMDKGVKSRILPKAGLNAVAIFNTIGVCRGLLDCKDKDVRTGVFAHELAHIKAHHALKKTIVFLMLTVLLIALVYFLALPPAMKLLCGLTFAVLYYGIITLTSWYVEYEADAIAAHYVGVITMKAALGAVVASQQGKKPKTDFLHPPLLKRIENLSITKPQFKTLLSTLRGSHPYLLWAVCIAIASWLISLVVILGIILGFMVPLIVSPTWVIVPRGLLVLSCICLVVSVVLLIRGLTVKTKR